jgi:hypothetical protein
VFDPGREWEFFISPPCPDRLWGLASLLFNVYRGLFPWRLSGRSVELTAHFHLASKVMTLRAKLPLPLDAFTVRCLSTRINTKFCPKVAVTLLQPYRNHRPKLIQYLELKAYNTQWVHPCICIIHYILYITHTYNHYTNYTIHAYSIILYYKNTKETKA